MEKYGLYDSPSFVILDRVSDTSDEDNTGIRRLVSKVLQPQNEKRKVKPRRIFEGTTDINAVTVNLQKYIKKHKHVTSTPLKSNTPNLLTSFKLSPIVRHRNSIISEHLVSINTNVKKQVPENDQNTLKSVDSLNKTDNDFKGKFSKESKENNKQEHEKKTVDAGNKMFNKINFRNSGTHEPTQDETWINNALSDLDRSVFVHSTIISVPSTIDNINVATTFNNCPKQSVRKSESIVLSDRKLRSGSRLGSISENKILFKPKYNTSHKSKVKTKSRTATKARSENVSQKLESRQGSQVIVEDQNTLDVEQSTSSRITPSFNNLATDQPQNVHAKPVTTDKPSATDFSEIFSSDKVHSNVRNLTPDEYLKRSSGKQNSGEIFARRSKRTASNVPQNKHLDEVNAHIRNPEPNEYSNAILTTETTLTRNEGSSNFSQNMPLTVGNLSPDEELRHNSGLARINRKTATEVSQKMSLGKVNVSGKRTSGGIFATEVTRRSKTTANDLSQNMPFGEVNTRIRNSESDEQLHSSSGKRDLSGVTRLSKSTASDPSQNVPLDEVNTHIRYPESDEQLHDNSANSDAILATETTLRRDKGTSDFSKNMPLNVGNLTSDEQLHHSSANSFLARSSKMTALDCVRNYKPDEELHCNSGKRNTGEIFAPEEFRRSNRKVNDSSQNMPLDEVNIHIRNSEHDNNSDAILTTKATLRRDKGTSDFSKNMALNVGNLTSDEQLHHSSANSFLAKTSKRTALDCVRNPKPDEQLRCSSGKRNTGEIFAPEETRKSNRTVSDRSQNMPLDEVNTRKRNPEPNINANSDAILTTRDKGTSDFSQNMSLNVGNLTHDEQLHHSSGNSVLASTSKRTGTELFQNMASADKQLHCSGGKRNSGKIFATEVTKKSKKPASNLTQNMRLDEINAPIINTEPDEQLHDSSANMETTLRRDEETSDFSQNILVHLRSANSKTTTTKINSKQNERNSGNSDTILTSETTLIRDEGTTDASQNIPLGKIHTRVRKPKSDKQSIITKTTVTKSRTNATSKKRASNYKRIKRRRSSSEEPDTDSRQEMDSNECVSGRESGFPQTEESSNMTRSNGRLRRTVNTPKPFIQATFHHSSILRRKSQGRRNSYRISRRSREASNGKRTTRKGVQSVDQSKISNNNTNNRINLEVSESLPDMDLNSNTTTTSELVSETRSESSESNQVEKRFKVPKKPPKRKAKTPTPSENTNQSQSIETNELFDIVEDNAGESEASERPKDTSNRKRPTQRDAQKASADQTKIENRINLDASVVLRNLDLNLNTTATTNDFVFMNISESTKSNQVEEQFKIPRKPPKRKTKTPSENLPASLSIDTNQLSDNAGESEASEKPKDTSNGKRTTQRRVQKASVDQTKIHNNNTNNRKKLEASEFLPTIDLHLNATATIDISESTESDQVEEQLKVRTALPKRKAKTPSENPLASPSIETNQLSDNAGISRTSETATPSTLDNIPPAGPDTSGVTNDIASTLSPYLNSEDIMNHQNSNKDLNKSKLNKAKEDFIPTIVNDRFVLLEWKSDEPLLNDSQDFKVIYCLKNLKSHIGVASCGYVVFAPGLEKKHVSKNQVLTFKVEKGSALVCIQLITTTVNVGSTFYIPLGTPYKIQNLSESENLILYFSKMSQL